MIGASELAIFAAVVEENSFSQAALKVGLSKTVISKKVSALEQELNTQLLYRTTRKLSLTDAGKLLYKHAKGINQQANDVDYLSASVTMKYKIYEFATKGAGRTTETTS